MGKFANILNTKKFVVTCEVNPPKGIDLDPLYEKVEMLRHPRLSQRRETSRVLLRSPGTHSLASAGGNARTGAAINT